jgi:hypothetical protein
MALGAFGRTLAQEQPLLRIKTLAIAAPPAACAREVLAELS